jgi:soluble lytic murein transglycosylase
MFYFRLFFIISLTLWAAAARADIYRYVDPDGVVHFSNAPPDGRYQVYLREGPKVRPVLPLAGSPPMDEWMTNYADRYARAHNLSPALVRAIMKAESNGQRKAVSRKGAMGVMQLMPFTSKRLKVSDPFDPIENIEGGVKYIKELLETFEGDLANTIAAYNAGPAAVKKHGGIPPYQETRQYVRRVMELYRQYSAVE